MDAYCSDATRIEDKLSSEIVDTINQLDDIRVPFDPAPILHMACLNVTLNLTFSQRFDPAGRMANEIFKTYEWRYVTFLLPLRSACLTVCLRVYGCLPVCLSLSSSLSMSVCLSVCLSVSAYLSVCLSVCVCLSICLSLSAYLSACLCLPVFLSVSVCVYLSVSVCVCLSVCLFVYICQSMPASLFFFRFFVVAAVVLLFLLLLALMTYILRAFISAQVLNSYNDTCCCVQA